MRKVYICHPFTGDRKGNIEKAKRWSREAFNRGYLPICVHIYLEAATGLDEDNGDREKLLELCLELVKICDELWICTNEVTEGMILEIRQAAERNIILKYRRDLIGENE